MRLDPNPNARPGQSWAVRVRVRLDPNPDARPGQSWAEKGHGSFQKIVDQKDLFTVCKNSDKVALELGLGLGLGLGFGCVCKNSDKVRLELGLGLGLGFGRTEGQRQGGHDRVPTLTLSLILTLTFTLILILTLTLPHPHPHPHPNPDQVIVLFTRESNKYGKVTTANPNPG